MYSRLRSGADACSSGSDLGSLGPGGSTLDGQREIAAEQNEAASTIAGIQNALR